MDLSTTYLGLNLRTPLMPSASPLSEDINNIKRMEDAGAAAVVLHSLFEEQLRQERLELHQHLTHGTESFAESLTYFPEPCQFLVGPEEYLNHIRKAKEAVDIPIIASLNGSSVGGWTDYAHKIAQAGADALELNIYSIPTDMNQTGAEVEQMNLEILQAVKSVVAIPVAVKVSPYFSNFANMARRFDEAGANGLVLFNRFYQPDIDLDELEIRPHLFLSTPQAMRLPLRWLAILYGRLRADLAATSGIHTAHDVIKMLMAGASVTQVCSVLFQRGIDYLKNLEKHLVQWLEEREYESVGQLKGSMSQKHCADPSAFERAQYVKTLHSFNLGLTGLNRG
jgi:dihydroorotate dehydrogenase (fumarate)